MDGNGKGDRTQVQHIKAGHRIIQSAWQDSENDISLTREKARNTTINGTPEHYKAGYTLT